MLVGRCSASLAACSAAAGASYAAASPSASCAGCSVMEGIVCERERENGWRGLCGEEELRIKKRWDRASY
jgi:hypothetical protein